MIGFRVLPVRIALHEVLSTGNAFLSASNIAFSPFDESSNMNAL